MVLAAVALTFQMLVTRHTSKKRDIHRLGENFRLAADLLVDELQKSEWLQMFTIQLKPLVRVVKSAARSLFAHPLVTTTIESSMSAIWTLDFYHFNKVIRSIWIKLRVLHLTPKNLWICIGKWEKMSFQFHSYNLFLLKKFYF